MRVRCPNDNHLITVSDNLIGQRIKCPHCETWMTVETPSSSQIQAGVPDLSLDNAGNPAKETVNLEHQIYDGLPPLSVMMALRRQQGSDFDAEDFAERYPMTDDDWKALSAFESVTNSVAALRTTLVVIGATWAVHLLTCLYSLREGPTSTASPMNQLAMLVVLPACFIAIFLGSQGLGRIKLGMLTRLLPWAAICVVMVVMANAIGNLHATLMLGSHVGILVGLPFNLIAAFDAGRSAWRVDRSLDAVSPPEISHRLTEALTYLG